MEQREFIKQMTELMEFAQTKNNALTREEVEDFCADLKLDKKQIDLVCAYMRERGIEIDGQTSFTISEGDLEKKNPDEKKENNDSKYLKVYRKELRDLKERSKEELEEMYEALRKGDQTIINDLVEAHLKRVVTLAGRYKGKGLPLEDLIQEGNLMLITCISDLCGKEDVKNHKKAIDIAVESRIIELVDGEIKEDSDVQTILARMNLLLEATKILAQDLGRLATIEELEEFTHMDRKEINMYVDFSKKSIELGQGE